MDAIPERQTQSRTKYSAVCCYCPFAHRAAGGDYNSVQGDTRSMNGAQSVSFKEASRL